MRCRPFMIRLLLLLTLTLLPGCWDRQEINDIAFVLASAFDLEEEEQFRVTVQLPLPQKIAGGAGGEGERPWMVDSAVGSTIREANAKQQQAYSRRLFFAHRRVLLIGEELGRADVRPVLDTLTRVPQNRTTTILVMTRGPARELLNVDSPAEPFPAEMIRELAQSVMQPPTTVQTFLDALFADGQDPMAPVIQLRQTEPGEGGAAFSSVEFGGIVVFRDSQVAGFLSPEDSEALLLVTGQTLGRTTTVSLPGQDGQVSVQIVSTTGNLRPFMQQGRPAMSIQVKALANIQENAAPVQISAPGMRARLEAALARQLEEQISEAVQRLQTEYRSDPLGFGDAFRRKLPRDWRWLQNRWEEIYEEIPVSVRVAVHIEHAGSVVAPMGHPETPLRR